MRAHIKARFLDDVGEVAKMQYGDGQLALTFTSDEGEPLATLSVNLVAYGLIAPEGHIWVRDDAESEGVAQGLVEAGVATWADPAQQVTFGPYRASATLMRVLV